MTKDLRAIEVSNLEQVRECLREAMPSLQKRYAVRRLAVFGSWARGEQQPSSDIDVLVDFERAPTIFGFMDLQDELSSLLSTHVDLVSLKALHGRRGERILTEAVAL